MIKCVWSFIIKCSQTKWIITISGHERHTKFGPKNRQKQLVVKVLLGFKKWPFLSLGLWGLAFLSLTFCKLISYLKAPEKLIGMYSPSSLPSREGIKAGHILYWSPQRRSRKSRDSSIWSWSTHTHWEKWVKNASALVLLLWKENPNPNGKVLPWPVEGW